MGCEQAHHQRPASVLERPATGTVQFLAITASVLTVNTAFIAVSQTRARSVDRAAGGLHSDPGKFFLFCAYTSGPPAPLTI